MDRIWNYADSVAKEGGFGASLRKGMTKRNQVFRTNSGPEY
jgi:hypothetical protein